MAEVPKTQRPPRKCLFCDHNANSPEHLWPKWMRRHFARTSHDKRLSGQVLVNKGTVKEREIDFLSGHTTTTKMKVVCKLCNERWMSAMEVAAKPFIEPMLLGKPVQMNKAAIAATAEWVALKMMMFDCEVERTALFTRVETLKFASDRRVPDGVQIWLFRTNDPERAAYIHRGSSSVTSHKYGIPSVAGTVQTTLFVVGRLVVFFIVNRADGLELHQPSQLRAKRLWVPRGANLIWPPLNNVTKQDIAEMMRVLERFARQRGAFG